jgi:hypothetical protein
MITNWNNWTLSVVVPPFARFTSHSEDLAALLGSCSLSTIVKARMVRDLPYLAKCGSDHARNIWQFLSRFNGGVR